MNLKEVTELLSKNNIHFQTIQYNNEKEFFQHIIMFPQTKNCGNEKITTVVIQSNNGKKNIEIQFKETSDDFQFQELWFGGYSFELFDTKEEYIATELLSEINDIMEGRLVFIEAYDVKKKRWRGDAVFVYDDDGCFGASGYRQALKRIEKPKSLFSKITKSKIRYEIYDWDKYRLIEK